MMAIFGFARAVPGWAYAVIVCLTIVAVGAVHERHQGAAEVQSMWDADKAARALAESRATIQRDGENAVLKTQQVATAVAIQGKYDEQIAAVRRTISDAPRMRLPAFCAGGGGPVAPPDTAGAQGGNDASPGTRMVPDRVAADIHALILAAEESAAAGRAAQAFIRANGMSP